MAGKYLPSDPSKPPAPLPNKWGDIPSDGDRGRGMGAVSAEMW